MISVITDSGGGRLITTIELTDWVLTIIVSDGLPSGISYILGTIITVGGLGWLRDMRSLDWKLQRLRSLRSTAWSLNRHELFGSLKIGLDGLGNERLDWNRLG